MPARYAPVSLLPGDFRELGRSARETTGELVVRRAPLDIDELLPQSAVDHGSPNFRTVST